MTGISKVAGGVGILSCIKDMHQTGLIYASGSKNKAGGDTYIKNILQSSKMNSVSVRDAKYKNWLMQNSIFNGINETFGGFKGYLHGIGEAGLRYIPKFAFSLVALLSKNPKIANASAIGVGITEGANLIKNTVGAFNPNDGQ